jgi:ribulose 1,5-bisphosphate synthetase/thiazole synthase
MIIIIFVNLNGGLLLELQTDIAIIGAGPQALTLAGFRHG